jgi:hypothetical protein
VVHFSSSEIRFGRRGVAPPRQPLTAEDIRRGVAALASLSPEHRRDPAARSACLFYALRSRADRMPVQTLVRLVETRVGAFEWMLANRPNLIAREGATAAFEAEVYEAIATEPLIVMSGHHRFDTALFMARLARSAARKSSSAEAAIPEYRPPS